MSEQQTRNKCLDCEGAGYVFIEDSTRTCSFGGGSGTLNENSPRTSNTEGDRE